MKHDLTINTKNYEVELTIDETELSMFLVNLEKEDKWLSVKDIYSNTYKFLKSSIEYMFYN